MVYVARVCNVPLMAADPQNLNVYSICDVELIQFVWEQVIGVWVRRVCGGGRRAQGQQTTYMPGTAQNQ